MENLNDAKETWWWNEEVQIIYIYIERERERERGLRRCKDTTYLNYEEAKKGGKK